MNSQFILDKELTVMAVQRLKSDDLLALVTNNETAFVVTWAQSV